MNDKKGGPGGAENPQARHKFMQDAWSEMVGPRSVQWNRKLGLLIAGISKNAGTIKYFWIGTDTVWLFRDAFWNTGDGNCHQWKEQSPRFPCAPGSSWTPLFGTKVTSSFFKTICAGGLALIANNEKLLHVLAVDCPRFWIKAVGLFL